MATARPMAARRAMRGRRAAGWVGRRQRLTAGREALIAPYPRTPAQPAPQGTDRAPLPPAQSTAPRERSEPGGWGERAHARVRGEGGRARSNGSIAGGPYTAVGGASPSPVAADRRLVESEPDRIWFIFVVPAGGSSGPAGFLFGFMAGAVGNEIIKGQHVAVVVSPEDGD